MSSLKKYVIWEQVGHEGRVIDSHDTKKEAEAKLSAVAKQYREEGGDVRGAARSGRIEAVWLGGATFEIKIISREDAQTLINLQVGDAPSPDAGADVAQGYVLANLAAGAHIEDIDPTLVQLASTPVDERALINDTSSGRELSPEDFSSPEAAQAFASFERLGERLTYQNEPPILELDPSTVRYVPGQEPYTADELARVSAMVSDAAEAGVTEQDEVEGTVSSGRVATSDSVANPPRSGVTREAAQRLAR